MANRTVKHYMQKLDWPNLQLMPENIEEKFPGLRYLKADGIYNVGKSKNIYTENYAESEVLRYYLPPDGVEYTNEATTITMIFVVIGTEATRLSTILAFTEYIRKGIHMYWDSVRERLFRFVVKDEIKVSDEKWHGTQPYIELTVPLQNIDGKTEHRHSADGNPPLILNTKVVTDTVNGPLQSYVHGANKAANVGYTTIYEAVEIDDISFALGTGSQLRHLAELNYFLNLDMDVLNLSNCIKIGDVSTQIALEDGTRDYVNVLPRKSQTLTHDFVEINLANTKYRGVNLKSGATLEAISYSDYTTEIKLVNQSALTRVIVPNAAIDTLESLTIEGCDSLDEIEWRDTSQV